MTFKSFMNYSGLLFISILFYSCGKEPPEKIKPFYEIIKNNKIPEFNSDSAYFRIEEQVKFGPRNPGSKGHTEALFYLKNELAKYAGDIQTQSFSYTGYNGEILQMTNIIARFNPGAEKRIMLCAHWDTRPRAEHAKDINKRNMPILGANDGASGCGILLEVARLLKSHKINYGIDIVFFDGEDYGKESDLNGFCIGAKHYADNITPGKIPVFAILLDLVGDKEARFPMEGYSVQYAPDVVNLIWGIASDLDCQVFEQEKGPAIYDDHVPLQAVGITTADIIDSGLVGAHNENPRRNYWHSEFDNMSNIGKNTLAQVGNVLTNLIYSIHFNKL